MFIATERTGNAGLRVHMSLRCLVAPLVPLLPGSAARLQPALASYGGP